MTNIIPFTILAILVSAAAFSVMGEPLMDWSPWEKYRGAVEHPAGYINREDLANARGNVERYEWAKEYARSVESSVQSHLHRFTDEFVVAMIEPTTPLRAYGCPICSEKGLGAHPGGSWSWSLDDPEHVKCRVCSTVFPNEKHPETVVVECKSKWGKGQKFGFYGGKTIKQWGYPFYRPSFSGMIRACKVGWCRGMASRFALAYALTEKPEYADVTRKLLLRFAQVYPNWLLVSEYGEIADMDPHVAGLRATKLPEDELVYPPNKPDKALYAGYWEGCRAAGGGQEGYVTRAFLQAYELTYHAKRADGAPLYSEAERIQIERDLILESCVHLIGEKNINNKSVGNRIAVGMVGISLGHPVFVRFGLEGWDLTLDKWFLADGCTPESPAYALMSLSGIHHFPQAVRGYSDPPGYRDEHGQRIENLKLYEGKYGLVWQRMFEGLQGNLRFPPYADSYRTSEIGRRFAELLAVNYPDNPQYLALLREYAGDDLSKADAETAIFLRPPGLEQKKSAPLHLEDNFFPVLCLGQLRTGEHGRRSLALLSASQWGAHHHRDSLNLHYWKDGRELLSDLGYLWDHPKHGMLARTFAHNTGMVDLKEQKTSGRGGRFHLFHTGEKVKVMEASSQAYDNADLYRRTVVQIDHGENSYLVDIFRLRAPGSRDLVYHGPNANCEFTGIHLQAGDVARTDKRIRFGLRFHVTGEADEICVDDVSITLEDGTELAVNPSADNLDDKGKPAGWNHYSGDGVAEWGAASPGRTDAHCAHLKVTRKGKDGVNQALIHGDTNGYTGPNALQMPEGSKGKITFWIRGRAQVCNVGLVLWRNDPASPSNREHIALSSIPVTPEWTQHSAQFLFRGAVDLENIKSALSPDTWKATWKVAEDLQFSAFHSGQKGEVVSVGEGWGQRDYRNTDLGATLPYIVRRHSPAERVSAFCTVHEAHKPEAAVVKSAVRLQAPTEHAASIVAMQVQTRLGADIVISQLQPATVEVHTPVGEVRTDAAVAVISVRNGKVAFAAVADGSLLRLDGQEVQAAKLRTNPALAEQGKE